MISASPLRFLFPGWFSLVMGLSGLSLAWHRSRPWLGDAAERVATVVGVVAGLVMLALLVASVIRASRHGDALAEDLQHPVRHPFVAACPIGLMLLATVAVQVGGVNPWVTVLWLTGSVLQLMATVWVLSRWIRADGLKGLGWAALTPVMFIPVVGNVVAPLAGVTLGMGQWAAAQAAIGLLFWPVLLALLMVRVGMVGMWPQRLLPATFITVAPPAVGGLALLALGAPLVVGWAAWGCAVFFLAWSTTVLQRALDHPFSIAFWGLSFPLAAFTALTLKLAETSGTAMGLLGVAALALTTLVIAGLCLATLKGLRRGTLLAPEVQPIAAAAP